MALTPEDVLNKTFTQTQFRRGYDEREVDDFLDEVVAEMRRMVKDSEDLRARAEDGGPTTTSSAAAPAAAAVAGSGKADEALTRENRDLRARLDKEAAARAAADKRISELEQSGRARDEQAKGDDARLGKAQQGADERIATVNARAKEAEESAQQRIAAANAAADKAEAEAKARQDESAKAAAAQPVADTDGGAGQMAAAAGGGAGASGLIALAQRLHDEHVAEGTTQRDKLISDAQAKSTTMVTEAEAQRKKILDDLNEQKSRLEAQVAELTTYERDYRRKLKDFIGSQLKGLETNASVAPEPSSKV
jgi:DivIVA domain-containing protein